MPPRIRIRGKGLAHIHTKAIRCTYQASLCLLAPAQSRQPNILDLTTRRGFSSSNSFLKKGNKAARQESRQSSEEDASDSNNPHNFSPLEDGIAKSLEKLQRDLSKLRTGGRFNPEVIESLRVHIDKNGKETVRLGDLAQIIPKGGRTLALLVGEKEHIKPIVSAIQGSKDLNLQPQPDGQNLNQLNVPIPPPTKESRDQAVNAANKSCETAIVAIRNARAHMQKHLRALELKRVVRPDDLRKAHKDMEKVVEKGIADVKKLVEAARKSMEQ